MTINNTKKLIVLLLLLLTGCSKTQNNAIINNSYINKNVNIGAVTTLTTYDGAVSDTSNFGTGGGAAQGFQIPANKVITGVQLKGSRGISSSGTFRIEIWEGGASPVAGTLKKAENFASTILPAYTTTPVLSTVNFSTSSPTLTGGATQYYLVVTCPTGNATDELRWSIANPGSYASGTDWYYSGGYVEAPTVDHNFSIFGDDPSSGITTDTNTWD